MEIVRTGDDFFQTHSVSLESILGREKTTAPHERADYIQKLVDGINVGIRMPHKPVTFKQINGQLRKFSESQLLDLIAVCSRAKNFGAFFWWKVRSMKHEPSKVS